MVERKPRIGVTWVTPGEPVSDNYINAICDAGGEPVVLRAGAPSWEDEVRTIDGLLLTGGGDVSPAHYSEPNKGHCELVDDDRDRLELDALHHCLDRGLPVLGVCRGFQLINVALGGRLIQDIDSERGRGIAHPSDSKTKPRASRHHPARVVPETALARIIARDGEVEVNSRHHQGLTTDMLAPGLVVNALAPDGIVEGFERDGGAFLLGVQCHPERLGEVEAMVPVFRALVLQARERDREPGRQREGETTEGEKLPS